MCTVMKHDYHLYPFFAVGVSWSPEPGLSTDHSVDVIAESRLPRWVVDTSWKAVGTAGGKLVVFYQAGS